MRLLTLLALLLFPVISFSQVNLRYLHLNWNVGGRFDAPNFKQFINTFNTIGPKPPGVTNYGFKIRPFGADAFSVMTGFGTRSGRALFTVSYVGGSTLIDRFGDTQSSPSWTKSLNYDYHDVGIGALFHLFKSKNENSRGFPRIEYQVGLDREFNVFQYRDKSGVHNKYRTNNFGASSFIQYNFYAPYLGGAPIRVVWGINLRYHRSLNPVDFSGLRNDLNFNYSNNLSESFKDLTIGITLGFLSYNPRQPKEKPKPLEYPLDVIKNNPMRVLELDAVDSITGQNVKAGFDALDERREKPITLLYNKYILRSVFREMLTVYVTARAKGYFIKQVPIEGYDTLKSVSRIELAKIPRTPMGVFYFEQSTSQMTDINPMRIDSVVSILQKNDHMNIAIIGHTSSDGSSRLNRTLSVKRAKVIRKLLVNSGVEKTRISISGVGSTQPKVAKDTEEYQSMNRRVEVFLRD